MCLGCCWEYGYKHRMVFALLIYSRSVKIWSETVWDYELNARDINNCSTLRTESNAYPWSMKQWFHIMNQPNQMPIHGQWNNGFTLWTNPIKCLSMVNETMVSHYEPTQSNAYPWSMKQWFHIMNQPNQMPIHGQWNNGFTLWTNPIKCLSMVNETMVSHYEPTQSNAYSWPMKQWFHIMNQPNQMPIHGPWIVC